MIQVFFAIFLTITLANQVVYGDPIIGIDLGTTYSSVCFQNNYNVEIIPNEKGFKTTPTVVALSNDEFIVGEDAQEQAIINPNNTFYDIKRLTGRSCYHPTVSKAKKNLLYNLTIQNKRIYIEVPKYKNESPKLFSIDQIQAMVLTKLKNQASSYLGQPIKNVVMTVPIGFDDSQKQATIDIAKIAGLNVVKIISEPKAVAIAYGKDKEQGEKNILVFDFGGGTLDITVLKIKKNYIEDISHGSEINLGGEDFDFNLVKYFIEQIKESTKIDIKDNKYAIQALKIEAKKAKEILSSQKIAIIKIKNLIQGYDFNHSITREKFEDLNENLFERTKLTIQSAYDQSNLSKDEIADVILAGGSSRIPKVQQIIENFFTQSKIIKDQIQDELVCVGAAIQANQLTKKGQQSTNRIVEISKTPISFGVEIEGGLMSIIIPKLSKYPLSLSKLYTTIHDYQSTVLISIFQGENKFTILNTQIGEFELTGIQVAKKRIPQIEVTFSLDFNGILQVTAIDLETKSSNNQVIAKNLLRPTEEEIQNLTKDNEDIQKEEEEKLQSIEKLKIYQNEFLKDLQMSEYKDLLKEIEYDQIIQLLTSSTQWVKMNEHNTKIKKEVFKKELENLQNQINKILNKKRDL
ncbi:unnamed protein product [Paramecium primaurelia]|uniref:Uncharacterized protein n=1 Tax=Paramecium primaurelia TaxID=5886 RepID=A0A8S1Q938_PARPR|nr:unnamed protein product [Paramecium primaurelia]